MQGKTKKVISKYYEFITTRIKLVFLQKKFRSGNVTLKYILQKEKNSHALIVVFASCTRFGLKARYNYMRTLGGIKANKLFILDDFASDHRGSYYMGENCTFSEEKATLDLIGHISETRGINKVICCGSSKGGYAALNFGLRIPNSTIISGGPQYHLGIYLIKSTNTACLEHIVGDVTGENDEKVLMLNDRLKNLIYEKAGDRSQSIYLHFSDQEHTYREHIKDLLDDLTKCGFNVQCDIAKYENHSDISYYFPDFLLKTLNAIEM